MKNIIIIIVMCMLIFGGSMVTAPGAAANGWATAGKILAGVAGADLLFNGANSMVGRTVTGIGTIFTGGSCYRSAGYGYAQPAPAAYGYSAPPPRRCWEEVRRVAAYDAYGNFLGYFDRRVSVCSEW